MGHELKQTHGGFSMNSTIIIRNNIYQTKNGKIEIKVGKNKPHLQMKVKSQQQRCWKWDETLWTLKLRKMSTTIRVKEWCKHLKKKTRFLFRKKWHLG